LSGNPRLLSDYDYPYRNKPEFGAEWDFDNGFSAVWNLVKIVPTTQHWARVLWELLRDCPSPNSFNGAEEAIIRWQIDSRPLSDAPRWHERETSFFLRSRIADRLPANEALLKQSDAASRLSFYRRFHRHEFPNWQELLGNEKGEECIKNAFKNHDLLY